MLSALEWDATLRPEHAHHHLRDLYEQVHDQCLALSRRLRADLDGAAGPPRRTAETDHLRQRLADLSRVLEARRQTHAG